MENTTGLQQTQALCELLQLCGFNLTTEECATLHVTVSLARYVYGAASITVTRLSSLLETHERIKTALDKLKHVQLTMQRPKEDATQEERRSFEIDNRTIKSIIKLLETPEAPQFHATLATQLFWVKDVLNHYGLQLREEA